MCLSILIAVLLFVCMAQAETAPDPAAAEALSPSVLNRLLSVLLHLTVAALVRQAMFCFEYFFTSISIRAIIEHICSDGLPYVPSIRYDKRTNRGLCSCLLCFWCSLLLYELDHSVSPVSLGVLV